MVVLKDRPSIVFFGFNNTFGYTFILKGQPGEKPTFVSYNRLKFLSRGGKDVYYCEDNGKVTRNWNPISIDKLKSIINNQKQEVISQYRNDYYAFKEG
jgi:hypothetical protein